MIFKFRLVSDEVDKFKREIQIDADASFLDLRDAICESVNYDKNQMSSFFLCDEGWDKGREITLEDMGLDSSEDAYLMDECILRDFIEDDGQRLIFVFDYMTDRCFYLEMKESMPGQNMMEPLCSLSLGTPPPQYIDMEEFDAKLDAKARAAQQSADAEIEQEFNSDLYDDEDIAGFDEMNY